MAAKVLGQSSPAAATPTDLYVVPSAKAAVCSTLAVCNTTGLSVTYRVYVRIAGAAVAITQAIAYEASLPSSSTDLFTIGMTLTATDVVTVYASSTGVNFTLFGDES